MAVSITKINPSTVDSLLSESREALREIDLSEYQAFDDEENCYVRVDVVGIKRRALMFHTTQSPIFSGLYFGMLKHLTSMLKIEGEYSSRTQLVQKIESLSGKIFEHSVIKADTIYYQHGDILCPYAHIHN